MSDVINTIGQVPDLEPNQEQVELYEDGLSVDMSEEAAAKSVDEQIDRARNYWQKFSYEDRQKKNLKYYQGYQIDTSALRDDQEKSIENDLFRNIETIVPIATSRTPELTATPAYKNEDIAEYSGNVVRVLQAEWEIKQGMQKKMGHAIRNHQTLFVGVMKVGFDPETEKFWTKEIAATDLVISKDGQFVAQYIKDETLGDMLDKFPEKQQAIMKEFGVSVSIPTESLRSSQVEYIEAWDNRANVLIWKYKKLILAIDKNPHFDYDGSVPPPPDPDLDEQPSQAPAQPGMIGPQMGQAAAPGMAQGMMSQMPPMPQNGMTPAAPVLEMGQDGKPLKVKYNHFDKPRHPFIFLTSISRGVHVLDDTTLLEQAIGPQDWINKRKRQIGMNADSTNGHWLSSGDFIDEEEFQKLTGGVNEKIWLNHGLPKDGFVKLTGEPLPGEVFQDLQDSRASLDNIMGTHDVTRGARTGAKTATQDMLQKDQDYGRVDGYVRDAVEVFAQEWFEYMYHMHLVYKLKKTAIAVVQDDDYEDDTICVGRQDVPIIKTFGGELIPVPLALQVKQGSTLPRDEVAEYQRAVQAKDILAPIDFFKLIGVPNPKTLYKNLLLHQLDPYTYFFPNDKDIQAALAKKSQSQPKLAEPPKMSISVTADANTAEGAALLEQQGVVPQGTTQMSASREVGEHASNLQEQQAGRSHQTAVELLKQAGVARMAAQDHVHNVHTQGLDHAHEMEVAASQQEAQSRQLQQQAAIEQQQQAQQPSQPSQGG